MIKHFISRMTSIRTKKEDKSSDFSKFFRKATSAEKKRVFLDVAKSASKEQLEVIRSVHMSH